MGLKEHFKIILSKDDNTTKQVFTENALVKNNLYVHPDLMDLIWIGDGKSKNFQSQARSTEVFDFDGFSIKIEMFGPDEPSLLFLSLPIHQPSSAEAVERPPYYPYYKELNSKQRWLYWKFLSDPYNPSNDIGYVFIFYYGLERHLLSGNFEKAFNVVLKLRDTYSNKSFQMYSSNALILSAMLHKRGDYAQKFIDSLDKDYEFQISPNLYLLCKVGLNMPITAYDIMLFYKAFGFTNNRYIKSNPDLFLEHLNKNIFDATGHTQIYAAQLFSPSDIAKLNLVSIPIFANISIREKEILIPDITQPSKFTSSIFKILYETHEDTKYELAQKRKKTYDGTLVERNKSIPSKSSVKDLPAFNPDLLPYNITEPLHSIKNKKQFFSDLEIINTYLEKARTLANIPSKIFIEKKDIVFKPLGDDVSHFELNPYTKTGRLSKYPLAIHYRTKYYNQYQAPKDYFGSIYYLADGSIGKARLINWITQHTMYIINLSIFKNELVVKSVETIGSEYEKIFLYKFESR